MQFIFWRLSYKGGRPSRVALPHLAQCHLNYETVTYEQAAVVAKNRILNHSIEHNIYRTGISKISDVFLIPKTKQQKRSTRNGN